MAKKQFKAESKRLLDMMINSIYTHREIFLRELISNASDAIDKMCYKSLTDSDAYMDRAEFNIKIVPDKAARTLTISDNGIGMTAEDLESNLGVIARSGSLQFRHDMEKAETEKGDIDIIGQFGVGFYSAFMVSERVEVISRAYGAESASKWESEGADGYTISESERESHGSDVILHLKPDTEEENYSEYLETWQLRSLIKKYSDYVRYPILMDVEKSRAVETEELDEDGKKKTAYESYTETETINSMVPIWQRAKGDAPDEECFKFYREKYYDTEDPLKVIRVNAEGAVSYRAMLFIPGTVPMNFYTKEFEPGLQLYTSGVMIMERCADLLPEHFRFVRGVVDSQDLSLNISRELLQHDRQLKVIETNLEKKIKSELKKMMTEEPEKYEKFYKSFGLQLKYGTVNNYGASRELLSDLLMFYSSSEKKLVSLSDYVKAMPEGQKYIYFACGESVSRLDTMPQTEQVKDHGYAILYMTDEVDEFVTGILGSFEEKEFKSINADDLGLESDEEKAEAEKKQDESRDVLDFVKTALDGAVSEVVISHKLKSHPVCLSTKGAITLEMERYFASLPGGEGGKVKAERVLELNASHKAFADLSRLIAENSEKAKDYAQLLYMQALLIAGMPVEDPTKMTELAIGLINV